MCAPILAVLRGFATRSVSEGRTVFELLLPDASLTVNRGDGKVKLFRTDTEETLTEIPFQPCGTRFGDHVFPALRKAIAGEPQSADSD